MSDDIHKFPSQLADRFQVRMPEGLRGRIAEAAKANNRSMNSEIVARLEASFGADGMLAQLAKAIETNERRIAALEKARENAPD